VNVLVLHSELGMLRGGGENFVKNLFSEFARRGHQVHCAFAADLLGRYPVELPAALKPMPVPGWWCRQVGQSWLSILGGMISHDNAVRPFWDRLQSGLSWRNFRWYNLRFTSRVAKKFASQWTAYDLVFVNSLDLALLAASHRPTMLWLAGPLGPEMESSLRQVPVVSADGDAFLQMREFLGEHITELSIGLDGSRFQPGPESERNALGWDASHCVFGYVGRLTQLKGADLMATAFSEIARDYPQARLLIVGQGESEQIVRSTLKNAIEAGQVIFNPGVDHSQLALWYRAMDVLLLPSRYENFSNALIEAAACGIPFIASDIGGNRILRNNGGVGELFEAGSVTSLTRRMHEFIVKPTVKRAQAHAFSSVVREKYNWGATADRMEWMLETRLGLRQHRENPGETAKLEKFVRPAEKQVTP
jgi:glycosyltransferase involved in cell wall biosynthesis